MPPSRSPGATGVGIITNTGGPAVIATDVMVAAGLELPPLSEKTEAILKENLFAEASVNNPVDVLATGTAAHYRACLDAMMDDDNYDCIYVNFVTPFFVDTDSIAREIAEVNGQQKKPMVCNLMTDRNQWTETVGILKKGGVPCFSLPKCGGPRPFGHGPVINGSRPGPPGEKQSPLTMWIAKRWKRFSPMPAVPGGRSFRPRRPTRFSTPTGSPWPPGRWPTRPKPPSAAAKRMGFPVVVKADAESIVHKSDSGGVAVNLVDADAVGKAVGSMQERLTAPDLKFFVQKFIPGGTEVIFGAKAEPGLGHLIMFGMGGIYVEVLKDVVFNLTPLTDTEAGRHARTDPAGPLVERGAGPSRSGPGNN